MSLLPSANPNLPVLIQNPPAGQLGGVVINDFPAAVRTGMAKSIDLTAILPSGGPPGASGGCAVSVEPLIVNRSNAGDRGVPGAVITSISSFGPLKTWSSPAIGSSGGPNPLIALNEPTVSRLSAGQAFGPSRLICVSDALHSSRVLVS